MGFDPISWVVIAAAVVAAAGAGYAGYAQNQAAKESAKVAEQNANAARDKAAYDEQTHRERVKKLLSTQRALYGSAGVTEQGTPLLVMENSAKEGEIDALAIRYEGEVEAQRFLSEASNLRKQGSRAQTSGFINAGSSLLSGFTGV